MHAPQQSRSPALTLAILLIGIAAAPKCTPAAAPFLEKIDL